MSSVQDLKDLLGRLRRQPKKQDLVRMEQEIGSVQAGLRGIFGAVRPMTPAVRLERAELLEELANRILESADELPAELDKPLHDLRGPPGEKEEGGGGGGFCGAVGKREKI